MKKKSLHTQKKKCMIVRTCFFNVFFQLLQKSIITSFLISQQLPNSSIPKYEHVFLEIVMCEKCRVTNKGGGRGGELPIHFFWEGRRLLLLGDSYNPLPSSCHAMLKLYRRGHISSSWKPVWHISSDEILTAVLRETQVLHSLILINFRKKNWSQLPPAS